MSYHEQHIEVAKENIKKLTHELENLSPNNEYYDFWLMYYKTNLNAWEYTLNELLKEE